MAKNSYQMPAVTPGDIVDWYGQGDTSGRPMPALVAEVGQSAISLCIFCENHHNLDLRPAVHHLDDPNVSFDDTQESGLWDYREVDKLKNLQLAEMEGRIAQLEKALQSVDAPAACTN